jgi:hypothetical protein
MGGAVGLNHVSSFSKRPQPILRQTYHGSAHVQAKVGRVGRQMYAQEFGRESAGPNAELNDGSAPREFKVRGEVVERRGFVKGLGVQSRTKEVIKARRLSV